MMDFSQTNYLIQELANYPKKLDKLIETLSEDSHLWQPTSEEWSIQMVLAHLSNCEPFFQARLERIVTEDNPDLPYFGPEQAIPISAKSSLDMLEEFNQRRQQTLKQVYSYSASDWERVAVHETMGKTSFHGQIRNIVNHDMEHLGQIHDVIVLWQKQFDGVKKD